MMSKSPLIVSLKCDENDNINISILTTSKDDKNKLSALKAALEPLHQYLKENTKVVTRTWMLFSSKEKYLSIVLPREIILAQTVEYLNFIKFIKEWEASWLAKILDFEKQIIDKNKPRIIDTHNKTHIPLYGLWKMYHPLFPEKLVAVKVQLLHSGRGMDLMRTLKINRFLLELGYLIKFHTSPQDDSTIVEIFMPIKDISQNNAKINTLSQFLKTHCPASYASYACFLADLRASEKPSHAF